MSEKIHCPFPNARVLVAQDDRAAWLAARKECVTGTDAAILATGRLYGQTPLTLWMSKKGLVQEEELDRDNLAIGLACEQYVLGAAARASGCSAYNRLPALVGPTDDADVAGYAAATLDGIVLKDGQLCTAEVKVGNAHLEGGELSEALLAQVQWGLYVTGAPKCLVAVLPCNYFGLGEVTWTWIERDDRWIERLVEAAHEFRQSIIMDMPPEAQPLQEDSRALGKLYGKGGGGELALPHQFNQDADRLAEVKAEIKRLEVEKTDIENRFKALMKDATRASLPNGVVITWSDPVERAGHTVKPSVSRTFRVKYPKTAAEEITNG